MLLDLRLPWHLSKCDKNGNPTIADHEGKVICEFINGDKEVAQFVFETVMHDEAPELDDAFFARAKFYAGGI